MTSTLFNMSILVEQKDNWVLTLPKTAFDKNFLIRLMELIQLEEMAQRNRMTSEEGWQISEDIKASWWETNGAAILAKIQAEK